MGLSMYSKNHKSRQFLSGALKSLIGCTNYKKCSGIDIFNHQSIRVRVCAVFICSLLSISGCQESSTGFGGGPPLNDESQPLSGGAVTPYTNQNVNGALQGEVWSASESSRMNLRTGEVKILAGNPVYPSKDGREYAELVSEYKTYLDEPCGFLSVKTDAIVIRDSVTDHPNRLIELRAIVRGPVVFSPDRQTLAVWASNSGPCAESFDDRFVTLLNRNGEVIVRSNDSVVGFDWMPDNRLAFMLLDEGVYKLAIESEPNTLNGSFTANLPALPGSPSRFRISPDGTQVLFEVVSGTPVALTAFEFREASVWIMDIDGSNLRQLADTSRPPTPANDKPRINQPVWSPDSQQVLMTENYKSGSQFVSGVDSNSPTLESVELYTANYDYLTYVMPANSALTLLPPESFSPTGVRPLSSSNAQGRVTALSINPLFRQSWTPAVEQSTPSSGSFPKPNGQVNRGFSGHVYVEAGFGDSNADVALAKINLATNEKSIIELDANSDYFGVFDISKSTNRIAMYHFESYDEEYLNIYDASGQQLNSFILANSNYDYSEFGRNFQISPVNENLIAWSFNDFDIDRRGIVVLDAQASTFMHVFDERRYEDFSWFPNGDMLLVEGTKVYRARANTTGFSAAELLFEHTEFPRGVAVAPDGQRLAFHSLGKVFTINLDGSGLVKVFSPTTHRFGSPQWSPDGQFLLINGDGPDFVDDTKFFVKSDAMNLPMYWDYIQDTIMKIGEAATTDHDYDGQIVLR